MNRRRLERVDPYYQQVAWDIIGNDQGKIIGVVYMLPYSYLNAGRIRRRKVK